MELLALALLFVLVIFIGILLKNSIVIIRGDEQVYLERKYFGKQMPDGRTVALRDEVGLQARVLGPGTHFLVPFLYRTRKEKFYEVPKDCVGLVRAITGQPLPSGKIMAKRVECDLFQDGEAFLRNGGEKGPQLAVLPEGQYRINRHLFEVIIDKVVMIDDEHVGCIEAIDGAQVTRLGGNFGSPVECDKFQDAEAFINNGGQKGPQIDFLVPGYYRINTILFKVEYKNMVNIPGGFMGLIEATDGERIPEGRLLAKKIEGHKNFFDGETFIKSGGEKGRQIDILMPGQYRINTMLFDVINVVPWINIGPEEIGIVTVNEGKPIMKSEQIAADLLPLEIHNNFQDAAVFVEKDGQKGLQMPVLRAGNYAINPWFANVEKAKMVSVQIGTCGVVTSFVGEESEDMSEDSVNAKIVKRGAKGIWGEPLQPGLHALNTKICKVDIVPTTQILLNWADNRTNAHDLDNNLKTIVLRTADAFNVSMDVSVIIHIRMVNASKVIANLGSVKNMISQVLEPAISSHFRNAAQYIMALDLYTRRRELQETAKKHIIEVLKDHHIDSKDTLIADVVLPVELTKIVTDRKIAEQEKETYSMKREAQIERKGLENETAQANMQGSVVKTEREVDMAKNIALGEIETALGKKQSKILEAEGLAISRTTIAEADAKVVKQVGEAGVYNDKQKNLINKLNDFIEFLVSNELDLCVQDYKLFDPNYIVPYKDIYGDFIEGESTSYEDNKDVWKENMLQIARGLKKHGL